MASFYLITGFIFIGVISGGGHAFESVESSYLPIQLQCKCPFLNLIHVSGIDLKDAAGQYSSAEIVFPGISAATDNECRAQLPSNKAECNIYLTGFNLNLNSGEKVVIHYRCLMNGSVYNTSFSESGDDVKLMCASEQHSIDIKDIKVEAGQPPMSVQTANQKCSQEVSFQKDFLNLPPPYECTVARDDRQGCIMVSYACENMENNGGGVPVFPGFGR